jgi:hypothetical protein
MYSLGLLAQRFLFLTLFRDDVYPLFWFVLQQWQRPYNGLIPIQVVLLLNQIEFRKPLLSMTPKAQIKLK